MNNGGRLQRKRYNEQWRWNAAKAPVKLARRVRTISIDACKVDGRQMTMTR